MRLGAREYFGRSGREVRAGGASMTATRYAPLQEQPWHVHENATLFVHLAGGLVDESEASAWTMPQLAVTYHPSLSRHRGATGPEGALGINVELTEAWFESQEVAQRDLGAHRPLQTDDLGGLAISLARLVRTGGDMEFGALILEIVSEFAGGRGEAAAPWLRSAEEAMREGFRGPMGLSSVAAQVGVHPVHLARAFRARHGRSVTEHLQRLRLAEAARRVLAGDSLGEAALQSGFLDQFYLSRLMRSRFGFAPKLLKGLGLDRP